jgi:hypothetical protein
LVAPNRLRFRDELLTGKNTMVNPTGFIEYERVEVCHRPIPERIKDWYEIDRPLVARVLTEPHSRIQRPGLPQPLARGGREPALDEQLSRDHRPRLSGPVRSGLHPVDK